MDWVVSEGIEEPKDKDWWMKGYNKMTDKRIGS